MSDITAQMARRWKLYGRTPNAWALGGTENFPEGHVIGRPEKTIVGTTGRQVGKTDELADFIDRSMNAAPGADDNTPEVPPAVLILSFDYPHAEKSVFKYVENLTRVFGPDAYSMNQNKHMLVIRDPLAGRLGAKLEWVSSQEEFAVTGFTSSAFGIDEAQAIPDRVIDKFLPTNAIRSANGVVFGTPDIAVDQTWFQGLYEAGQDPLDTSTHSFTVASWEAPWMNMTEILQAKARMDDVSFRRLYGGEWVESSGLVFTGYDSALLLGEPTYEPERRYVMAVDLAITNDFNVVMIGDPLTRTVIYRERWNLTDPLVTYDRVIDIWGRFGKPKVWVDASGMGKIPARELASHMGTGYVVPVEWSGTAGAGSTAWNKMDMVRALAGDLQHRHTMFPGTWDDVIREMKSFIYTRTPSGRLAAAARTNAHDDLVMTLVMLNAAFNMRTNRNKTPRNYLGGNEPAWADGFERLS